MGQNIRLELPERGPDEPDLTEKQRGYIQHLLDEAGAENFSLDIESLGKWQASALINRLQDVQNGIESDKIHIQDQKEKTTNYTSLIVVAIIVLLLIIWLAGKI